MISTIFADHDTLKVEGAVILPLTLQQSSFTGANGDVVKTVCAEFAIPKTVKGNKALLLTKLNEALQTISQSCECNFVGAQLAQMGKTVKVHLQNCIAPASSMELLQIAIEGVFADLAARQVTH